MNEPRTLAGLTQVANDVAVALIESEGEIAPEQEAVLQALIAKVDNCDLVLRRLEAERQFYADYVREFQLHVARIESRVDWLKSYIKRSMIESGRSELHGEAVKFVLQKNPPSVVVLDESKIDATYFIEKTTRTLDKKRILAEMKMGAPVDGVELRHEMRLVSKPNSMLLEKAVKE